MGLTGSTALELENKALRAEVERLESVEECLRDDLTVERAENERMRAAGNALVDFYNGPVEAKRPDVFQRLMQRLANALTTTQKDKSDE